MLLLSETWPVLGTSPGAAPGRDSLQPTQTNAEFNLTANTTYRRANKLQAPRKEIHGSRTLLVQPSPPDKGEDSQRDRQNRFLRYTTRRRCTITFRITGTQDSARRKQSFVINYIHLGRPRWCGIISNINNYRHVHYQPLYITRTITIPSNVCLLKHSRRRLRGISGCLIDPFRPSRRRLQSRWPWQLACPRQRGATWRRKSREASRRRISWV